MVFIRKTAGSRLMSALVSLLMVFSLFGGSGTEIRLFAEDEESSKIQEISAIPEETSATTEETTVPEETSATTEETTVPEETSATTEETTVPEETSATTEETTVPEETSATTKETTVPEETSAITEETTEINPDEILFGLGSPVELYKTVGGIDEFVASGNTLEDVIGMIESTDDCKIILNSSSAATVSTLPAANSIILVGNGNELEFSGRTLTQKCPVILNDITITSASSSFAWKAGTFELSSLNSAIYGNVTGSSTFSIETGTTIIAGYVTSFNTVNVADDAVLNIGEKLTAANLTIESGEVSDGNATVGGDISINGNAEVAGSLSASGKFSAKNVYINDVGGKIDVDGTTVSITNFYSKGSLQFNDGTKVNIGTINTDEEFCGVILAVTNTAPVASNLKITNYSGDGTTTVNYVNSEMEIAANIPSGTVYFNATGTSAKNAADNALFVTQNESGGKEMGLYNYRGAVRGEITDGLTIKGGEYFGGGINYPSWSKAVEAIANNGSSEEEYTITLNDDLVADNAVLPTKAAKITIKGNLSEKNLTFPAKQIIQKNPSLVFEKIALAGTDNADISVSSIRNGELSFLDCSGIKDIKGTTGSNVTLTSTEIQGNITGVNELKFGEINTVLGNTTATTITDDENAQLCVYGKVSATTVHCNGVINLFGGASISEFVFEYDTAKVFAGNKDCTVKKITYMYNSTTDNPRFYIVQNDEGIIPNVSITNYDSDSIVQFILCDGYLNPIELPISGTKIFTALGGNGDGTIRNAIAQNEVSVGNLGEGDEPLKLYDYNGTIKAEYENAVWVSGGNITQSFPSMSKAFEAIESEKDKTASYAITINRSIISDTTKFPIYARELNFCGSDENTVVFDSTSLTFNTDASVNGINFAGKGGADVNLSTRGKNLAIINGSDKFANVSGTSSTNLILDGVTINGKVTTFGTVCTRNTASVITGNINVTTLDNIAPIEIRGDVSVKTLKCSESSKLSLYGGKKAVITSLNTEDIGDDAVIEYRLESEDSAYPAVTINNVIPSADKKINIKVTNFVSDAVYPVESGTQIFSSGKTLVPTDIFGMLNKTRGTIGKELGLYNYNGKVRAEDGDAITVTGGTYFGIQGLNYSSWSTAVKAINDNGSKEESYTITFNNSVIADSTAMPSNAAYITINADSKAICFKVGKVTQLCDILLENITVDTLTNEATTWNAGKYNLSVNNTDMTNINIVGSRTSTLEINSLAADLSEFNGISNFSEVTVAGEAKAYGNISGITELTLGGTMNIYAGKTVSVVNITESGDASVIKYNGDYTGKAVPTVSGIVTGNISLVNGEALNGAFTDGTKLLTASNASSTADLFVLSGTGKVCYKNGKDIFAGSEAFELFVDNQSAGKFAQWTDVIAKIDSTGTTSNDFNVIISSDQNIGKLILPKAGKYHLLMISPRGESEKTITFLPATVTLTGNVTISDKIILNPETANGMAGKLALNIGSFNFTAASDIDCISTISGNTGSVFHIRANIFASGAVKVDGINITGPKSFTCGGALTANQIIVPDGATLVCDGTATIAALRGANDDSVGGTAEFNDTAKITTLISIENLGIQLNKLTVKDTHVPEGLKTVITPYSDGIPVQFNQTSATKVFSAIGKTYGNQFVFNSANSGYMPTREGNFITAVPSANKAIELFELTSNKSLGMFNTYQAAVNEITRIGDANVNYEIRFSEDVLLNGALTLPSGAKYRELVLTSDSTENRTITVNRDITLTGGLRVTEYVDIVKVDARNNPQSINVSLGKYKLTVCGDKSLGNVTGSTNSEFEATGGEIEVNNLSVNNLELNHGSLDVSGNISVTNNIIVCNDNVLKYYESKNLTLGGDVVNGISSLVTEPSLKLIPCDSDYNPVAADNTTVFIDKAPNVCTSYLTADNIGTKVFYKTLTNQIMLDEPTVEVHNQGGELVKRFVTVNDAIGFVNSQSGNIYKIMLTADITCKNILSQTSGKRIIFDSEGAKKAKLNFTGGITVNSGEYYFNNVILDNGLVSGINFVTGDDGTVNFMDNCQVKINNISGTGSVAFGSGQWTVDGAITGATTISLDGGTCTFKKNVAAARLDCTEIGNVINITGTNSFVVNDFAYDGNILKVNRVDNDGDLLQMTNGATLFTLKNTDISANCFKTQNTMPNSTENFLIKRNGTNIVVGNLVAKVDNNKFASFNAAMEYVDEQTSGTYVIQIFASDTSVDMSELPSRLTEIKNGDGNVYTVTASGNISLGSNLKLTGINLVATTRNISANNYTLTATNSTITASKITNCKKLALDASSAKFRLESSINDMEYSNGGCLECPSVVAYTVD